MSLLSSRRARELLSRQYHHDPWKSDDANSPGHHFQSIKDKKVIKSNQRGFMKVKSCLTKLIAFFNDVTNLVNEGEEWMLFTLTSARSVFHNIFTDKLMRCEGGVWIMGWMENWLNCQALQVVISACMMARWRPVTSDVPQGISTSL